MYELEWEWEWGWWEVVERGGIGWERKVVNLKGRRVMLGLLTFETWEESVTGEVAAIEREREKKRKYLCLAQWHDAFLLAFHYFLRCSFCENKRNRGWPTWCIGVLILPG